MRRIIVTALVGVVLLGVLGGWALLSHPASPGTITWAQSCALAATGVLGGALIGRLDPLFPGVFALVVAVGSVAATVPASLSGSPLAPPLGYMNANGALLLAGAAGAVVATSRRSAAWQLGAAGVAALLGALCLVDGAQAAAVGCVVLAAWSPLRDRGPGVAWLGLGAAAVATPMLLTVGWAAGVLPRPGAVESALSTERFSLWQEAWTLLGDHPLSGVGPGRFAQQAPTAADPDLAWAHSALLQTGAELGWVGVGLLLLAVVVLLLALGRDALLLGVLLLPASVDYVLHFGGVVLLSSVVLGGAIASTRADASPTPGSPRSRPPGTPVTRVRGHGPSRSSSAHRSGASRSRRWRSSGTG